MTATNKNKNPLCAANTKGGVSITVTTTINLLETFIMTNTNVTMTNLSKQQQRALDPDFIKLAAHDLITIQLYEYQDMSEHEFRDAAAKEDETMKNLQYGEYVLNEAQDDVEVNENAKVAYDAAYKVAYDAAKWDEWEYGFSPPQKKVILPFATICANEDTEELTAYKIHEYEPR